MCLYILCTNTSLKKAIERRASRTTWNPTMMLHRMQNVIDTFLRYHGFANCGGLRAYPMSNSNRSDEAGDFKVMSHITKLN